MANEINKLICRACGKIQDSPPWGKDGESPKDINILELMNMKITRYFKKNLYISDLIYDLESYLNQLTTVGDQWKKDFRTLWLDIEIAYSLALDQGLENLTDEGTIITENSLHTLKRMTQDKINDLKTHENE